MHVLLPGSEPCPGPSTKEEGEGGGGVCRGGGCGGGRPVLWIGSE